MIKHFTSALYEKALIICYLHKNEREAQALTAQSVISL